MSRISWDVAGEHIYELGLDRGVLYVGSNPGVPWNGLISVNEKNSGGSSTAYYMDGVKYLNTSAPEEFGATIQAFMFPDEFLPCDGTTSLDNGLFIHEQPRVPFNLAYRTKIGNDLEGDSSGYKIHLIYNALTVPSQRQNQTTSDTPSPINFSWDITASPISVPGFRPSAHITVDTTVAKPGSISDLENILYGTLAVAARMPTIPEIVEIFEENATLRITDNADGTWTATTGVDGIITLDYPAYISSLIDDFNAATLDSGKWTVTANADDISVLGGSLNIVIPAANDFAQLKSIARHDVTTGFYGFRYSSLGTCDDNGGFFFGIEDSGGAILEMDALISTASLTPYAQGSSALGSSTGDGSDFLPVFNSGGWLGVGNVGEDNVVHFYKSADTETWTEIASITFTGTFDGTTAVLELGTFNNSTTDNTYKSLIDEVTYFTAQTDPPTSDVSQFSITWDSAVSTGTDTYTLTSL